MAQLGNAPPMAGRPPGGPRRLVRSSNSAAPGRATVLIGVWGLSAANGGAATFSFGAGN
jgi:hypothetical protein